MFNIIPKGFRKKFMEAMLTKISSVLSQSLFILLCLEAHIPQRSYYMYLSSLFYYTHYSYTSPTKRNSTWSSSLCTMDVSTCRWSFCQPLTLAISSAKYVSNRVALHGTILQIDTVSTSFIIKALNIFATYHSHTKYLAA